MKNFLRRKLFPLFKRKYFSKLADLIAIADRRPCRSTPFAFWGVLFLFFFLNTRIDETKGKKERKEERKKKKEGEGKKNLFYLRYSSWWLSPDISPRNMPFFKRHIRSRAAYSIRDERNVNLCQRWSKPHVHIHTYAHAIRASFSLLSAKSGEKLSSRYLFSNRGLKRRVYLGREFIYTEVSINND